jgi:O-antigen/teichoic acid export membrane protein
LIFILVAGIALVFSAFAPELMILLADEKYHEAVYVIPPVALGMFFSYVYVTFANVEFFYNQTKFTMFISMGGALLNVGLNYIGIMTFGYIAAAYTTLFCYVVFAISHYFYMSYSVKKALGVTKIFRTTRMMILFAVVLAAGLMVIAVYDLIIVRYSIMAVILIVALIKRKEIIALLKSVRKPKKVDAKAET